MECVSGVAGEVREKVRVCLVNAGQHLGMLFKTVRDVGGLRDFGLDGLKWEMDQLGCFGYWF